MLYPLFVDQKILIARKMANEVTEFTIGFYHKLRTGFACKLLVIFQTFHSQERSSDRRWTRIGDWQITCSKEKPRKILAKVSIQTYVGRVQPIYLRYFY